MQYAFMIQTISYSAVNIFNIYFLFIFLSPFSFLNYRLLPYLSVPSPPAKQNFLVTVRPASQCGGQKRQCPLGSARLTGGV
jgi:hypothetical protein